MTSESMKGDLADIFCRASERTFWTFSIAFSFGVNLCLWQVNWREREKMQTQPRMVFLYLDQSRPGPIHCQDKAFCAFWSVESTFVSVFWTKSFCYLILKCHFFSLNIYLTKKKKKTLQNIYLIYACIFNTIYVIS